MASIDWRSLGYFVGSLAPLTFLVVFGHAIAGVVGWGAWLVLLLAATALFFVFSHRYLRRLDEAAWQAQKHAWLWGGTAALAIGFIVLGLAPMSSGPAAPLLDALMDALRADRPADSTVPLEEIAYRIGAIHGAAFIAFAQVLGFLVVWIGWWLRKR